jgi:hypothetical protein
MKLGQNAQGDETKMTFTYCWNHPEAARAGSLAYFPFQALMPLDLSSITF